MAKLSPRIEIINHFDNLMSRIDVDIEQSIEKFKEENQLLGDLKFVRFVARKLIKKCFWFTFEYFDCSSKTKNEEVMKPIKVIDYLNQVRKRTIDELTKVQEDSLEQLKTNSNQLNDSKNIEEMKSRLFAKKFHFQVLYKPRKKQYQNIWVFNLYTFVVDFYLSQSDIKFLEKLINGEKMTKIARLYPNRLILNERLLLILLLRERFWENVYSQQYPSHVINFRKQDLLKIKAIKSIEVNFYAINLNSSSNNFSKLEKFEIYHESKHYSVQLSIEGLSSLKSLALCLSSLDDGNSFGNQSSVKILNLDIESEINIDSCTKLFETFPNVEELCLEGNFSNINFDRFVNLKKLELCNDILEGFNFDLLKNICGQLEYLSIELDNIGDEEISKLLNGNNFPNVLALKIWVRRISRLEKKLLNGFPMLESLDMTEIGAIDKDAFSNLKHLKSLSLKSGDLSELDPQLFSCLSNLEGLYLQDNNLNRFDLKIMNYLANIKDLNLQNNFIRNKRKLRNYCQQAKIGLIL